MVRGKLSSKRTWVLVAAAIVFAAAAFWRPAQAQPVVPSVPSVTAESHGFAPFSLFSDPVYTSFERAALLVVLGIAVAGLLYAWLLIREVNKADKGTPKMQAIAAAVREGANAYLGRQFL